MLVWTSFRFQAAHNLPRVPAGHKCARLHGHDYRVEIFVEGTVDDHSGMVVDYAEIATAFKPLLDTLDHSHLNEIAGLENPTSEMVATWIWERLAPGLNGLRRVSVWENQDSGSSYEGPEAP